MSARGVCVPSEMQVAPSSASNASTINRPRTCCSSGGVVPKERINAHDTSHGPGLHVPFAERIRKDADIMTIAVGLILDGPQAAEIVDNGRADLVAIARTVLDDPFWPLHQARAVNCRKRRWARCQNLRQCIHGDR